MSGRSPQTSIESDLGAEFRGVKDTAHVHQSASLRRPGGNTFTFTPPQDLRLPTEVSPSARPVESRPVLSPSSGSPRDRGPTSAASAAVAPITGPSRHVLPAAVNPQSKPTLSASLRDAAPPANKRRISLRYQQEDNPRNDLLTLAGGQGNPVVIQMIAQGGRAEQAGVKPGAVILSINGTMAFRNYPAWQVRALIQPPATVEVEQETIISPASPRCKEIRLTRKSELQLGIAPRGGAWHAKDSVMLAEEVVFQPRTAPLWLSSVDRLEGQVERPPSPGLYELRRPEAHRLVSNAVRNAWASASKQAEHTAHLPRGSRARSSSPFCGLDECMQWNSSWKWDPGAVPGAAYGSSGPPRSPRAPEATRPMAPQLPLSSRGQNGDASPLRWVSPVFAPLFAYTNSCSPRSEQRGPRSPSASPRNRCSSPKPERARGDTKEVIDREFAWGLDPDLDERGGMLLQHQL